MWEVVGVGQLCCICAPFLVLESGQLCKILWQIKLNCADSLCDDYHLGSQSLRVRSHDCSSWSTPHSATFVCVLSIRQLARPCVSTVGDRWDCVVIARYEHMLLNRPLGWCHAVLVHFASWQSAQWLLTESFQPLRFEPMTSQKLSTYTASTVVWIHNALCHLTGKPDNKRMF